MAEKITIDKIKTAKKPPLQSKTERPSVLTIGTKLKVLFPGDKDPTDLEVAMDADPKKGKILQIAPIALAVAEFKNQLKTDQSGIENGSKGPPKIEYGEAHQRQKVTLLEITEPTSELAKPS